MPTERCPHCGASMKKYWHRVTPLLVEALIHMYRVAVSKGENKVHIPKEVNFSKTMYNNFQKLRFHGLVAHYKEGGVNKSGYWLITKRGADFLHGEIAIPRAVQTFRNRVVDHKPNLFYISEVLKSTPYLEKIDDFRNS